MGSSLYVLLSGLVLSLGVLVRWLLHRPATKAKAAAVKEVGSTWVEATPPAVVNEVVEVRVEAKADAQALNDGLAAKAKQDGASAVGAASALNDAFGKLKGK